MADTQCGVRRKQRALSPCVWDTFSHSPTHTLSISLSVSLSFSLSLSRTSTHSLTHSLTHTHSRRCGSSNVSGLPGTVATDGPWWGHPMLVLEALCSFLEPFCGHLSPKVDKVSEELTLRYPHEEPCVDARIWHI